MDEEKFTEFLEENRFTLVSKIKAEVFLDYMRSNHYLDQEDCETIRNNYVFQTRRQKAGEFINILQTKGPDAFNVFMDLLEWEYPHVFEKICNKKAKAPPPGYTRHSDGRMSQALHDFVNMGFRERDLMEQVDRLQNLLEYAQNELRDLERENSVLRESQTRMRQLEEKLSDSEMEFRNLQEENRRFMKKNIQLLEEVDALNKKIQIIEKEHDTLMKTVNVKDVEIERIKESQVQLKECVEQARRESQRIVRLASKIDRSTRKAKYSTVEENKNMATKLEILQSDLEAEAAKNQELCQELSCVQDELYTERSRIENMNCEILKVKKDRDQHRLWLTNAERKISQYFTNIQELEKEKRKIEEEKTLLQTKLWDIQDQKHRLFSSKHETERRFEKLQQNFEKLKLEIDFSKMQSGRESVGEKLKRHAQYSPSLHDLDPFLEKVSTELSETKQKPMSVKWVSKKPLENLKQKPAYLVETIRKEKAPRPRIPIKPQQTATTCLPCSQFQPAGEPAIDHNNSWKFVTRMEGQDDLDLDQDWYNNTHVEGPCSETHPQIPANSMGLA